MPGDGDEQPRPGPRKRPPGRPGAPAQQRPDDATRPAAPTRGSDAPDDPTRAQRPVKKAKKAAKKRPAGAGAPSGGPPRRRPPGSPPRPPRPEGQRPEAAGRADGPQRPDVADGPVRPVKVDGAGRPVKKAKKAAKKRPPAGTERRAGPARPERPERPEGPPGARPAGPPTKKASKATKAGPATKATKRRPEGGRPPAKADTAPGEQAPQETAAKKAGTKKAGTKKVAARRAEQPGRAGRPPAPEAPALHDWAAEDQWGPGPSAGRDPVDPYDDLRPDAGGDATAAVPAADLLSPSSPSVVVRGMPAPDLLGFDDLAEGAPLLEPGVDLHPDDLVGAPPVEAPPAGPPVRYTRSGKPKKLRGKAKRIYKAKTRPPSRLLNHYDVNGPRIRLGFLWFVGLVVAIGAETATDLPFLALVYGGAAGFAGWQAAREWRKDGTGAVPWAAAAIGATIGMAGSQSPKVVAVFVLLAIPLAAIGAVADEQARAALPGNIGLTLQSGLFVGIAAAMVPLTWKVEPGAAISLILLVSAYEVGDYVVGSGSLNAFEGPIAGILAVAAVMLPLYAVQLPPIDPDTVITYGLIVAIGCPLSQIVGSAVLPWSDAPAPAVRRLDSLLITGPVWFVAVGLQLNVF